MFLFPTKRKTTSLGYIFELIMAYSVNSSCGPAEFEAMCDFVRLSLAFLYHFHVKPSINIPGSPRMLLVKCVAG